MNMTTSYLRLMVCQAEGVYGEVGGGVWRDMRGVEKTWGVCMCLSLCDMNMSDLDKWSEAYMHFPYIMGHLSSMLFRVQVSRIMSFGWQIACVIDIVIQISRHGLVRKLLWHMWCLCDVGYRDFSVWQGDCDNFILTRWAWQSESDTSIMLQRLMWCMCCKTDMVHVVM